VQQPGGKVLRSVGRAGFLGWPLGELRQVVSAWLSPQPDRHRPVAGVVGQDHQVAPRLESAVL
jgi:hypothetical protein